MQELGLVALVNHSATAVSHSARPDSPVVPDAPPPGRLRLHAADFLHRLADRLAHPDRLGYTDRLVRS